MPRILVYEHLTASGLGRDPASPEHGMYREGRAMRDALVEDLRRVPGCAVEVADRQAALDCSVAYDRVIVIAPESGGVLREAVRRVTGAGGHPLGPTLPALDLASDKLVLAGHWARNGVPTPDTLPLGEWPLDRVPAVVKPRDGAGSTATFRVNAAGDLAKRGRQVEETGTPAIAQDFVPGRPASVSFMVGAETTLPLIPSFQRLSDDGRFRYLGGDLPIPPDLAERAIHLGRRAVECVPGLYGYVGVDLVLGDRVDGSADSAIEINPRLTTSYVGLRILADFNLAGAMLDLAAGSLVSDVSWKPGRVRFEPDGTTYYDSTPRAVCG